MKEHYALSRLSALVIVALLLAVESSAQKASKSPYGKASYAVTTAGTYMKDWLIAGPLMVGDGTSAPTEEMQKKFFDADESGTVVVDGKKGFRPLNVSGKSYPWTVYSSAQDKVDFDGQFQKKDYAIAFGLSEIVTDVEKEVLFAFGSDDAIKVYLNGKLVHSNWTPRGIIPDQDLVPVTLVKGSNQLLVKIQDMQGEWGFTTRILDPATTTQRLVTAAASGNLDDVRLLLNGGANINGKTPAGLSAVAAAMIGGRTELLEFLKSKGGEDANVPAGPALVESEYGHLKGKKAPGIAILVSQNGKILYEGGFGYADIEKNELITPQTKFRIGSITKQFIGAAIMRLQEEGKLSVHDKLSKYIPDFSKGNEVTIHHLLTHTSGIHSYTNKNEFISRVTKPISEDDLVALIKKEPYDFEPGERFLYNNSGYFLLGHIIRKVTGSSYGEYLREAFFKPLGMSNTGVYENAVKITNEAKGYKSENGSYSADINWDMSWAGGAGALYSTVEDLHLWNQGVFGGKILKPGSLNAALTPVILNNGSTPPDGKYGYGWFIGDYRGQEVVEHGGGLHGFSTRIARYPEEDLTVVMLTNVIPTEVTLNPNTIAEYFAWDKMDAQNTSVAKDVNEDVSAYEGRYEFGNGLVITVTSESNKLFAQVTGQGKFPIFPSAPGEYFWRVVEARIKFLRDADGVVTKAEFSQNGSTRVIPKMKPEVIVSIDPALLEFYVGKYDFGDNVLISVTKEQDKLYAQTQTSPRFEIKPLSDTEFSLPEFNAKLTFVREGNAKASKFIMDMGGQKKDAPRIGD